MLFEPKTKELVLKFKTLRQHPISPAIKLRLMEGLMHQIKTFSEKNKKSELSVLGSEKQLQISQTNFTDNFSLKSQVLPFESLQQIECKIIQQQKFKMKMYEQIQNFEDDLFQLQKVIKSKKEFEQNLDKRIFEMQYIIEKNSKAQNTESKSQRKPLSARIKSFFM